MGELVVNNTLYWDTQEVLDYLLKAGGNGSTKQSTRTSFYRDIKQRLHVYEFYGRKKPWYRKTEVEALAEGQATTEHPHIIIRGLLSHWTQYAQNLGLNVDTINCTIEAGVSLSPEICKWAGIPETTAFVKRRRITFIDAVPVTTWYTAYPFALVAEFLDQIKHDGEFDVPAALRQTRGIRGVEAKDSLTAREASLYEQELLQMKRPEAVLNLQRAVYSEQGRLLWYSDMCLRAGWFRPEYRYRINEE